MQTSTRRWFALTLLVPAGLLGAVAFAQEQPERHAEARVDPRQRAQPSARPALTPERMAHMSGRFELGLTREEAVTRVNHAIDQIVSEMSWFRRSFAMRRLRSRNPVRDVIATEVRPGYVTVTYGDERHRTPVGQWQTVVAAGEPAELMHRVVGDRILQTFRTEEGQRDTVFVFSEDGRHLRLDVTVESPQLPRPLRYSLPYRRVTPIESPA